MSWFKGYVPKPTTSQNQQSESDLREAKRKKLEEERTFRAKRREQLNKQLAAAQASQAEADKALQDLLAIDPDIFEGAEELDVEISDDILNESIEEELENDIMNFDEKNEDNGEDAIKNLGQIKVNWDSEDPVYFFQKLETELQIFSINKQFTKRQALIRLLPDEVAKEFKHLVNLQETQAGDLAYKNLKTALIKGYGPRPEDAFKRAMSRVMVGKPSTLLKLLISDICPTNLIGCTHCIATIWGLFQIQIPTYLKTGLANETFSEQTMHAIMEKADNFWAANQGDKQVSAVEKPVTSASVQAVDPEVSAIGRGRFNGRGNRGNRRGGRGRGGNRGGQSQNQSGGQTQNQPDPRGQRHSSNPPWNSCKAHWVFASEAWQCQSPTTCPMKDKITPKNKN